MMMMIDVLKTLYEIERRCREEKERKDWIFSWFQIGVI